MKQGDKVRTLLIKYASTRKIALSILKDLRLWINNLTTELDEARMSRIPPTDRTRAMRAVAALSLHNMTGISLENARTVISEMSD